LFLFLHPRQTGNDHWLVMGAKKKKEDEEKDGRRQKFIHGEGKPSPIDRLKF